MSSILDTALHYMQGTHKREVTQSELLTIVSRKTGCSRESVRGSIIGDAGGRKLFGRPQFKKHWVVCIADKRLGKRKRFIRRLYVTPADTEAGIDYDTLNKQQARERGLKHLKPGPQKVITLAAAEGYCVKSILERCPEAEIINVERYPAVLAEWKKKGIPTQDHLCELACFIRSEEFMRNQYSLLNMDLMGYACPSLGEDLAYLNKSANVATIVLTLSGIKRFRNTGKRFKRLKETYRSDDPTREWLVDMMPDYRIVDQWSYVRDPDQGSRPMRMFVLKRKRTRAMAA